MGQAAQHSRNTAPDLSRHPSKHTSPARNVTMADVNQADSEPVGSPGGLLACETARYSSLIQYSGRYDDAEYQYRHVLLPKQLAKFLPKDRTATSQEWSSTGIIMSPGWENYELVPHQRGSKHILVFRRPRALGDKYPIRKLGEALRTAKPSDERRKPCEAERLRKDVIASSVGPSQLEDSGTSDEPTSNGTILAETGKTEDLHRA